MEYVYDDRPASVYDNLNTIATTATATTSASVVAATKATNSTPIKTLTPTYNNNNQNNINNNNNISSSTNQNAMSALPPVQINKTNFNTNPTTATTTISSDFADLAPYNNPHYYNNNLNQQQQQYGNTLPNNNQAYTNKQAALRNDYNTPMTTVMPMLASTSDEPATTATSTLPTIHIEAHNQAQQNTPYNNSLKYNQLSQHLQSELNATSQNIAAVKAALHDAKSKFFGLNGYNPESNNSTTYQLLPNHNNYEQQMQIVPAKTKTQPKYQNIPENSAIFRNLPPELPPKPKPKPKSTTALQNINDIDSSTPLTECPRTVTPQPHAQHSVTMPTSSQQLPYNTMYQQIPLKEMDSSQPSQAVYMTTTVPQNMKGTKIAGRHTPTRSSLRHSRMLVINNKNYQGGLILNPMNFKHPIFVKWLLILQIFIGILIAILIAGILFLSARTPIQENPFWSSMTLGLAGFVGLYVMNYKRNKRQKSREQCFIFMRTNSYILSLLAILLCCIAFIFAAIHFTRLTASDTKCISTNILQENASCRCIFHARFDNTTNSTRPTDLLDDITAVIDDDGANELGQIESELSLSSYKIEYRDLTCAEVRGEWTLVLICSMILNFLGFLISLFYIVMLVCYRFSDNTFYNSVQVSSF